MGKKSIDQEVRIKMEKQKIDSLLAEYEELWNKREVVFTLTPDMGWDAYLALSSKMHLSIGDYFERISHLELEEKLAVYNNLNQIYSKILQEENLFMRVLKHFSNDNSGGRKFLLNVCTSTKAALVDGVKRLDFDLRKTRGLCNCQLKQEIGLMVSNLSLDDKIKLKKQFNDGYYEYELHQCIECKTFWINDLDSDDGPARGWREPKSKYEFEIIQDLVDNNEKLYPK